MKNCKIVKPDASDIEIAECIRLFYKHISLLIVETLWSFGATPAEIKPKVQIKNMDVFDTIYRSGNNATILISHIGNWELLCQWAALYIPNLNIVTLYTPIKNKGLNELILNYRTRFGVHLVSTKSTLDLYRKQKQFPVAINLFAIDQNPGDPFNQYWCSFFNVEVPVISGAEKFALSLNQDVYFLKVEKKESIYQLELMKIDYDNTVPYDITHRQMKLLEGNILLQPYLWLLSHNRFKYQKKLNYINMIWKTIPTFESLLERAKNTMSDFLEMEFIEIGDDFLVAKMPVIDRTIQPMGLLHGGATAALAETVGSVCAIHCVDFPRESIVGLELNINHIRSLKEGFVFAKSTPIHIGKSTQVWSIENTDLEGNMISIARLTIMVIQVKK